MLLKLLLIISFFFNASIALAINETSIKKSVEVMTFSADAKTLFALNCYAANYIFLQYLKKLNINNFGIQNKLDKQVEFYVKFAISNMKDEKIDRKSFEKFNEWNLTYFNSLLPLNNRIDFNGALWQQLYQCNIKFEGLKYEKTN